MNKRSILSAALILGASFANAELFQLKITNLGPQGLSPLFYSAGVQAFDIFSIGGSSSLGIKNIAEGGNATEMANIAAAAGSNVETFGILGNAPLAPGAARMTTFSANASHPYFSFASMLGMTNDGFIGESVSSQGLMLFSAGVAQSITFVVTGQRAWDAGTELNTQNAADLGFLGGSGNPPELSGNNIVRVHAGIIANQGDSWDKMPAWNNATELARIEVSPVPEPLTLLTLAAGVVGMVRRRNR